MLKLLPIAIATAVVSGQLLANEQQENSRFAIAGYGDVKYEDSKVMDSSAFSARFIPIFLFSLSDKIHIEAETEISIDEQGETEVELEYADIHYFLSDTTTFTAGKFLLPFGQYGPYQHPSWINRSVFSPGIYGGIGGHGGYQPMQGLLPVMSDIGVGIQHIIPLGKNQKILFDLYMTNGLAAEAPHDDEEEGHDEESILEGNEEVDEHTLELPELAFEARSGDNNSDKALGGRIAYAFLPGVEVGASYYTAKYDDDQQLGFTATGFDINWIGNHYIVRGEYIRTEADAFEEDEHEENKVITFDRNGWYLQATFMAGKMFSVLQGTDFVVEYAETNKINEAERWAYGINYWLDSRAVIKATYEDTTVHDGEDDKRFAIQYSYGF
ncbi:porin [Pseudoalteromonas piratica]|uniref:Porin n=1 Tax=Pseudoalteromonas piratica TaxID=1348114 RepID=A0A0A7EIN9_9GAMM|nr:porin [Pseudoalteromonas piratica]AIY66413.1 porin [Pseudoalteromonas piratica]